MKALNLLTVLLVTGGFALLTSQQAVANVGDTMSGGGQIISGDNEVSLTFPVPADHLSASVYQGELSITFHNTSVDSIDKTTFDGTVTEMDRYPTCSPPTHYWGSTGYPSDETTEVINVYATGTLNGQSGYKVLMHVGDSGTHGNWGDVTDKSLYDEADTVRIELWNPQGHEIYDTSNYSRSPGGDFPNQSACDGGVRTYLNRGDLTITP